MKLQAAPGRLRNPTTPGRRWRRDGRVDEIKMPIGSGRKNIARVAQELVGISILHEGRRPSRLEQQVGHVASSVPASLKRKPQMIP